MRSEVEVTAADREKAMWALGWRLGSVPRHLSARHESEIAAVAQALAEERAKAREPFLALLDEEPTMQPLWEFERGALRGIEMCKEAIRRAAGVSET